MRPLAGQVLRRPGRLAPRRRELTQRRERARAQAGAQKRAPPAAGCGAGRRRRSRRRSSRSPAAAPVPDSTCSRVDSISRSYCTPDGQEVRHAMQPRQRSKCSTTVSVSSTVPSTSRSSGRSGRAASPSPRARARRWDRSAGRSRSARSRRSARAAQSLHGRARPAGSTTGGSPRSTYATRGPGRTSGALLPSQRARPGSARLQRAHLVPRVGPLAAERGRLRLDRALARPRRARTSGRRSKSTALGTSWSGAARAQSLRADANRRRGGGRGCSRSASRATSPSRPREPRRACRGRSRRRSSRPCRPSCASAVGEHDA